MFLEHHEITSARTSMASSSTDPLVCVHVCAPLVFSAPHGLAVWREGECSRVRKLAGGRRLHMREEHATELAILLAAEVNASFICWNAIATSGDPANLDPNYLYESQLLASPWHHALRTLRDRFSHLSVPMFLVDVHGKRDRREHLRMDVGVSALRWRSSLVATQLCDELRALLGKLLDELSPIDGKHFGVDFPAEGERGNGAWGQEPHVPRTLTQQANTLGVAAIQLELPRTLRRLLMEDQGLRARFAGAFAAAYARVVASGQAQLALQASACRPEADGSNDEREPAGGTAGLAHVDGVCLLSSQQEIDDLLRDTQARHGRGGDAEAEGTERQI